MLQRMTKTVQVYLMEPKLLNNWLNHGLKATKLFVEVPTLLLLRQYKHYKKLVYILLEL